MKVTLPDGTVVEGSREELKDYLPPPTPRNWDGSPKVTASGATATWDDVVPHIMPVGSQGWT